MNLRYEWVFLLVEKPFRLLHISDVHFSARTTHEQNLRVTDAILEQVQSVHCPVPDSPDISTPLEAICITGDLLSRNSHQETFDDALLLLQRLRECLPDTALLYSLGNHEMDYPDDVRNAYLRSARELGVTVLDNESTLVNGICFTGLTVPQTVYRNPEGGYRNLSAMTREMVESCLGSNAHHPCVLLAHSPLGFSAYAEWGADVVLSGHVHGGIVRIGEIGLLSPERKFLPRYTKGIFKENGCSMIVSAGIGKFRVNNPPEVICLDIKPEVEA